MGNVMSIQVPIRAYANNDYKYIINGVEKGLLGCVEYDKVFKIQSIFIAGLPPYNINMTAARKPYQYLYMLKHS